MFPNKESLAHLIPLCYTFSDSINPEFSMWGMLLPIYPIYCTSVLIVFCCHCLVHVEKVICFVYRGKGCNVYIYHIIISCCTIWCYYWLCWCKHQNVPEITTWGERGGTTVNVEFIVSVGLGSPCNF